MAIPTKGQQVWTLEACIAQVLKENLLMRRAEINRKLTAQSLAQARLNLLPTVGVGTGYFFNFGKTIDPTTNQFVLQNIQTNSLSISTSLNLFNGFAKWNTIKQSEYDLHAADWELQQQGQELTLQVLAAFLRVVLAKEQVHLAQQQQQLSSQQVDRIRKQVQAGNLSLTAQYEAEAQLALDESAAVAAANELRAAQLALAQLLNIATLPDIVAPSIAVVPEWPLAGLSVDEIFQQAVADQYSVKAAMARLKSSEKQVAIARGQLLPSVSLFANMSTNYSNIYERLFIDSSQLNTATVGFLSTDFTPVINYFPSYTSAPVNLLDQYRDNFGQAIGINVDISLFNNWQLRHNISRSKLQLLDAQYQYEQVVQQVRNDIETAWQNAVAAKNRYDAALRSETAFRRAFEDAQRKMDVGSITLFEYHTALNNYNRAQSERLQSKYQYVFNLKVLDFYRGVPLTL